MTATARILTTTAARLTDMKKETGLHGSKNGNVQSLFLENAVELYFKQKRKKKKKRKKGEEIKKSRLSLYFLK